MKGTTTPYELVLSDDGKYVTLMMQEKACLVLDAPGTDDFLKRIGDARSRLLPAVPVAPDRNLDGTPLLKGIHPLNQFLAGVEQAPIQVGAAIQLRSEMFGWQLQQLTPMDCQFLVRWLQGLPPETSPVDQPLN